MAVALLAVGSFLFALLASVFAPEDVPRSSVAADVYSRSAIGHHALGEMLRELGVPVTVSRWNSGRRAGDSAVLLLLEPRLGVESEPDVDGLVRFKLMLAYGQRVLLVLPKWRGEVDPERPGHVRSVSLVPVQGVRDVLELAGLAAQPLRPGVAGARGCPADLGEAPQFVASSPALRPLITCAGGVLLGERAGSGPGRLLVLSDPDVISNHGLARAENARLAWAIVELLRDGARPVLLDAELQGYEQAPTLGRELFRLPLLPALIQAVLAVAAWIWSGWPRFGRPLPLAPPLTAGKRVLIDATVALLLRGGHVSHLLRRYRDEVWREICRAYRLPAEADRATLLKRLAHRREPRHDLAELSRRVDALHEGPTSANEAVALARQLHELKEGLIRGSA